jgi:hypothetical protein
MNQLKKNSEGNFLRGTIYKRFLARLPTVRKKVSIYPSPSF